MATKVELGKQFLSDLLARVPEESRAALAAVVEDEGIATFAGEGVLRQQDYSRSMNDLSAKHQELTTWYDANKAALAAATQGRTGDPTPQPTGLAMADVEKVITERERGVATYIAAATDLSLKHFQEFGERLNLTELLADPEVTKLGILGVYDRKFAGRYQEKATKAETDRVEARVAERLVEERKKFVSAPYPVTAQEPSPLDALEPAAPGAEKFSPQAMTDEYNQLVANRTRVGA